MTQEKKSIDELIGLFEQTHSGLQREAARAVNSALVVRNWLFGLYISEYEKGGAERRELYGKRLVEELSVRLSEKLGKGFSRRSLDQFRQFYEVHQEIRQTLSAKSFGQTASGLLGQLPKVMELDSSGISEAGQVVEVPSDLVKSPYVLEFLGLEACGE